MATSFTVYHALKVGAVVTTGGDQLLEGRCLLAQGGGREAAVEEAAK